MNKFLKKILLWIRNALFPLLAYYLLRLVILSCRVKIHGLKDYLEDAKKSGGILALWHNRLLLLPYFGGCCTPQINYSAVISNSRDGHPLAKVTSFFPNTRAIRVAHNKRSQALKTVIKTLQTKCVVIITPDGPKGPPYEIKPGLALAATTTSSKIFPLSWSANRYWSLKTWDQMMIPKPFSQIDISIGKALTFNRNRNSNWEEELTCLKKVLLKLGRKN